MSARAYLSLILLAAAVTLERMGHFVGQSVLFLFLMKQHGLTAMQAGTYFSITATVSLVGALFAGGLAFALGPRPVAAIGALIASIGGAMVASSATPLLALSVLALGTGMFRPCVWAAAAEIVTEEDRGPDGTLVPSPRRFAVLSAVLVLMFLAINAGTSLAPVIAGISVSQGAYGDAFGIASGMNGFAFVLAAIGALVGRMGRSARSATPANDPYRGAETSAGPAAGRTPRAAAPPRAAAGMALLIGATLLTAIARSLTHAGFPRGGEHAWAFSVGPAVSFVTLIGLFVLWLAAAIGRWSLPPLVVWGGGLVVFGLGLFPLAASIGGDGAEPSVGMFAAGSAVLALGEAALGALGTCYAALSWRRGATLVLALFSSATWFLGSLAATLNDTAVHRPLLVILGLVCAAGGIVTVLNGRRLHRTFFDPPLAPPLLTPPA